MSLTKSPLQLLRGPSNKSSVYVGQVGEPVVTIDTGLDQEENTVVTNVGLSIHDGSTAGGWPLATKVQLDAISELATTTAVVAINADGQISNDYTKNGIDANTLTSAGNYHVTGCTLALHWPVTTQCFCKVITSSDSSTIIQEVITPDSSVPRYKRTYSNSEWGAWIGSSDTATILQSVYPIGSIYTSVVNTSPATLFGFGTWEAIEGRFLLAADSTYTAGSTGGSATHTITTNEMPSHTHTITESENSTNSGSVSVKYGIDSFDNPTGVISGSGDTHYQNTVSTYSEYDPESNDLESGEEISSCSTITIDTSNSYEAANTGGGQAMDILPPYLSVYMWKRTA